MGGADYLEPLLEAAQLGLDEGHDNDGFDTLLIDLAYIEPEKCHAKLEELLARDGFKHREAAKWLLEVLLLTVNTPMPGVRLSS